MALDTQIQQRAHIWRTDAAFDQATRAEITALVQADDTAELTDRFYRNLEFGTGGLRGILGAGDNRLNVYNIRKATFALITYIQQFDAAEQRQRSTGQKAHPAGGPNKIAIAYDSRRMSREFAEEAACVAAAHGFEALITRQLRPVPMLSFFVRHFACRAGICVTASHNPPNYNGFKVYWQTGGQLVPPHDNGIIEIYNAAHDISAIKRLSFGDGVAAGNIRELGDDADEEYFRRVAGLAMPLSPAERRAARKDGTGSRTAAATFGHDLKIVYTPLHGAGRYPVVEGLRRFGFSQVTVVPEQAEPDGDFPTVKSPNPEEPQALTMAIELAQRQGADLVLATDPDADRVGIAVRLDDGTYHLYNGNQIACLLTEYILSRKRETNSLPPHALVIKTVVTSDLMGDIARHYGAEVHETLTGFKWICDVIDRFDRGELAPARQFVCGGEESYGFLVDSFVRDKDGIIACCTAAEMLSYYRAKGLTLDDVLDAIFHRHGVYHEVLRTATLPGQDGAAKIQKIMEHFRTAPPKELAGSPVVLCRDYDKRVSYALGPDAGKQAPQPLTLPKSDVLQFVLADGSRVSVRPSGTEPKIKFYISVRADIAGPTKDTPSLLPTAKIRKMRLQTEQRAGLLADSLVAMASQA